MPRPRTQSTPFLLYQAEDLARRLVQLRLARGLTQKQLAEKVGITRDLLSRIETGGTRMTDLTVIEYAKALMVTTDELLGVSGDAAGKDSQELSLRLVQRMHKIQQLSSSEQKVLLRTIDLFLIGAGVLEGEISPKLEGPRKMVTVIEVDGPPPAKALPGKKVSKGQQELLPPAEEP